MVRYYVDKSGAYVLLGVLLALVWIFFALRLFVRLVLIRKPGSDDVLILLAIICYTAFTGFAYGLVEHGLGTDVDDDTGNVDTYVKALFSWFFAELLFILTSTFLRVACGLLLLHILSRDDQFLRWTIIVTLSIMVLYSKIFFFVSLFQCKPVDYFWNYKYDSAVGTCLHDEILSGQYKHMAAFFITHSIISALTDWTLGILPFFIIRNVQMSVGKKAIVVILLGLGIMAGVTAVIRIPLIIDATRNEFWDDALPMAATTAIEPALGLLAICSATLMPLFKQGLRWLDSEEEQSNSQGSHHLATLRSSRAGGEDKDSNSRTAILVETSWAVEDELEPASRDKTSEDCGMHTHKVSIGVDTV